MGWRRRLRVPSRFSGSHHQVATLEQLDTFLVMQAAGGKDWHGLSSWHLGNLPLLFLFLLITCSPPRPSPFRPLQPSLWRSPRLRFLLLLFRLVSRRWQPPPRDPTPPQFFRSFGIYLAFTSSTSNMEPGGVTRFTGQFDKVAADDNNS